MTTSRSELTARDLVVELTDAVMSARPVGDIKMLMESLFNTGRIGVEHLVALGMVCTSRGAFDPYDKGGPELVIEAFGISTKFSDRRTLN